VKCRRICVAGATGWTGSAVARAILASPDFELAGAVARSTAGQTMSTAVPDCASELRISATVEEALRAGADVLIDFTSQSVAHEHALQAISKGVHVVLGATGVMDDDWSQVDQAARAQKISVAFAANYAPTWALLQQLACQVAAVIPNWEIIDHALAGVMSPLGTSRELRARLAEAAPSAPGASNRPIHSVRLPGAISRIEAIFGANDEQIVLAHTCSSASPYASGALMAARQTGKWVGLICGLDRILDL
jgi:4-hydroxy-tetrahydrodipicolinate reductase